MNLFYLTLIKTYCCLFTFVMLWPLSLFLGVYYLIYGSPTIRILLLAILFYQYAFSKKSEYILDYIR